MLSQNWKNWGILIYQAIRKTQNNMIIIGKEINLLHITRELYSIKLICTNLYTLFSHVKKAYTANQNGVQLFQVWKYNQSAIA